MRMVASWADRICPPFALDIPVDRSSLDANIIVNIILERKDIDSHEYVRARSNIYEYK